VTALGLLRLLVPMGLAVGTAVAFDRLQAARGLLPPCFRTELRRALGMLVVAGILWLGVFAPLGSVGVEREVDLSQTSAPTLFLLHGLFVAAMLGWLALGFPHLKPRVIAAQLGLVAPRVGFELLIGLVGGAVIWLVVVAALMLVGLVVYFTAGPEALPQEVPTLIPFLAGLPVALRLAIAASAGVVEEAFFRGFLQPRMGIGLSTLCFVLAHTSYQQPWQLLGVTLLSLAYAGLVRWRQSIWAAMVAHFLFDAVQLLVLIPIALENAPQLRGG
jgi:membrane protease YdiL (CAAX protease family)